MDDLEKVETIRTKCNVSYTDAKPRSTAADGNVLDAIIWLESQGKTPDHVGARPPPSPCRSTSPRPKWSPRRPPTTRRARTFRCST